MNAPSTPIKGAIMKYTGEAGRGDRCTYFGAARIAVYIDHSYTEKQGNRCAGNLLTGILKGYDEILEAHLVEQYGKQGYGYERHYTGVP